MYIHMYMCVLPKDVSSIQADLDNAVVLMVSILPLIFNSSSPFSMLLRTVSTTMFHDLIL